MPEAKGRTKAEGDLAVHRRLIVLILPLFGLLIATMSPPSRQPLLPHQAHLEERVLTKAVVRRNPLHHLAPDRLLRTIRSPSRASRSIPSGTSPLSRRAEILLVRLHPIPTPNLPAVQEWTVAKGRMTAKGPVGMAVEEAKELRPRIRPALAF